MKALLRAEYLTTHHSDYSRISYIYLQVRLVGVEFVGGAVGNITDVFNIEIDYQSLFESDDVMNVFLPNKYVSMYNLYLNEQEPLVFYCPFSIWVKEQWLHQTVDGFEEKYKTIKDKIANGDLEDQKAFDALKSLGFSEDTANLILNLEY
jgi:hypothetical protein